ncbi:MAG: tetratricopeptide repeat protein, partial [Hyphomicrobiales bacterium]
GGDLALIYLHMALYLRPDYPVAQFLIADILDRQRRLEKSNEMYATINDFSPLKREARIQRALNLDQLERTDEAKTVLDAIIAEDATDRSALESTANMLRSRMRYKEAEPYYSRAVALATHPGRADWRLYYSRAITYERLKQWPSAEKDFLKALELSPDQPLVLNYLGYTWIDQGVKLQRALKMVRKAVEQRPNDGYIVDSLGWAYFKMGRFEEAVQELERATELRADDAVINDHLGDAYWRVGRRLEARFQWSQVLELDPEEDQIDLIKEKLKSGLPELSSLPGTKGAEQKKLTPQSGKPVAPAPGQKPTESQYRPVAPSPDTAGLPAGAGSDVKRTNKANWRRLNMAGRIIPGQTLIAPSDQ